MSVLNIEKKIAFIHVPKTAGVSMEETGNLGTVITRHYGMEFYTDLVKDDPKIDLKKFFKFAFVRNPYDRLASGILNHALKNEKNPRAKFNDFLIKYKYRLDEWITTKPMHTFICVDDKIAVDFVGRFENLQEDWGYVCEKLKQPNKLPFINKGKHTYENLYTLKSIEIVREVFKKDFELFGYNPNKI